MIVRDASRRTYTIINNDALKDASLSFRARGVFAYLMSQPDTWNVSAVQIAQDGKEGRDAVRAALRELEEAGYLNISSGKDEKGKWATRTTLYESPQRDSSAGNSGPLEKNITKEHTTTIESKNTSSTNIGEVSEKLEKQGEVQSEKFGDYSPASLLAFLREDSKEEYPKYHLALHFLSSDQKIPQNERLYLREELRTLAKEFFGMELPKDPQQVFSLLESVMDSPDRMTSLLRVVEGNGFQIFESDALENPRGAFEYA